MTHPETIGAYRILEFLGEGGMGLVFRAEHRTRSIAKRQGPVVVKTLHPHLARKPEFRERFEQEAEVGASIDHPGVVRYLDLVADQDTVALVMAYVPGKGLDELLEAYREPEKLLGLLRQLASVLDHLHGLDEPVVHRDLKPSNIRIAPEGKAVILDFGIARAGASTMTRTSTAMGTPDYMAPEQELDAKRVDGRADVYALGVIAFRLLTGRLPWPEDLSWSAIFIKKAGAELDLGGAGEAEGVFRQVMAPIPEDRFVKASAFVNALGSAVIGARVARPKDDLESRPPTSARDVVLAAFCALEGRRGTVNFNVAEVVRECRGSDYADSTIATHVTSKMCRNAPDSHAVDYDDLECVGAGLYRRIGAQVAQSPRRPVRTRLFGMAHALAHRHLGPFPETELLDLTRELGFDSGEVRVALDDMVDEGHLACSGGVLVPRGPGYSEERYDPPPAGSFRAGACELLRQEESQGRWCFTEGELAELWAGLPFDASYVRNALHSNLCVGDALPGTAELVAVEGHFLSIKRARVAASGTAAPSGRTTPDLAPRRAAQIPIWRQDILEPGTGAQAIVVAFTAASVVALVFRSCIHATH